MASLPSWSDSSILETMASMPQTITKRNIWQTSIDCTDRWEYPSESAPPLSVSITVLLANTRLEQWIDAMVLIVVNNHCWSLSKKHCVSSNQLANDSNHSLVCSDSSERKWIDMIKNIRYEWKCQFYRRTNRIDWLVVDAKPVFLSFPFTFRS
jgi:hypothetical protein